MTVATRCMNKNCIWITVFGQNCLHIFTSHFCLPLSLALSPLSVYSFSPTETLLSSSSAPHLPAVSPLGLMNDLAGGGSCGCGGASRARRGEETLFLSPPGYYSHSPGYTTTAALPGTGWHRLIGLSVRMTSWSWVGFALLNKLHLQPDLFISVSANKEQGRTSRRQGSRCSHSSSLKLLS